MLCSSPNRIGLASQLLVATDCDRRTGGLAGGLALTIFTAQTPILTQSNRKTKTQATIAWKTNTAMKIHVFLQPLARRTVVFALVALGFGLAFISPTPGVAAPAFRTASGFFGTTLSDVYTLLGTSGGETYYREDLTFLYTGDLVGTATDVNYIVVHADGSFESFATEVCTGCTLAGRTGNFTANYFIIGADFDNLIYTGYFAFTGGSGGLAGLNGFGTFGGANADFSYSYRYRLGH